MNFKKTFCALLVLVMAFSFISGCSDKNAVEEVIKIPVEVYEAKEGLITREIILSGITEPEITARIFPDIMGAEQVTDILVNVGDKVNKGTVLVYLDSQTSKLSYEMAEASFRDAEKNYERNKLLFEAGAISGAQLEQIETGYIQAKNSFEMRAIELGAYGVKSPIDGVVSSIEVTKGNLASPQSPVAVVSRIDKLLIKSSVNEKEVNNLFAGKELKVIVPNLKDKEFTGLIKSVAPTMDLQTRSFPVEIEIENIDNEIKPGTFAKATIEVERKEGVITVPTEAVIVRGNQARVFVVKEETAQSVQIETGLSNSDYTEVTAGISSGELVITRGNDNVVIGDLVRIVQPMEKQVELAKEEAANQ